MSTSQYSIRSSSFVVRAALLLIVAACGAGRLRADDTAARSGTIAGTISTQNGSVRLPGVVVVVHGEADGELPQPVSDGNGTFTIPDLPPGRYTLSAALDGFQAVEMSVTVAAGATVSLTLDLPFALTEHVDVVARTIVSASDSLATTETVENKETQLFAPGEGIQTAVRLTPGVIELSSGDSIDGARPNQASLQLGAATLVDPSTNLSRVTLPSDGIDSVSVMSNPYEVEFGRFSSGLVMLQTRRAGDDWKVRVNNLEPNLRVKRYTVLNVDGVVSWKPSVEFGGPIIKDRVFMEQTGQYYYQSTDINSRPENELRTNKWVSSLTRIDANLSERHSLVFSAGFVPGSVSNATLGTFTPPAATPDIDNHFGQGMMTERAQVGGQTFLESTLQYHTYDTSVQTKGLARMQLLPDNTLGNFFNRQNRSTTSFQWVETASSTHSGPLGVHAMKVGIDLLQTSYEGTSQSRAILVKREDGTLARRLAFGGIQTKQSVHGTDFAAFAQDRLQPGPRWWVEFGGRLDRDAVTGHTGATPRVGAAVLLDETGNSVLRGGVGVFYERTPLVAGAFGDFESAFDTRYEADGVTPVGPAVLYTHVTDPNLQVARSTAWDVAYDKRLNRMLALRLGVLGRQGSRELVVDPVRTDTAAALLLSSTGESSYLQEEVNLHVTRGSASRRQHVVHPFVRAAGSERSGLFLRRGTRADHRIERVRAGVRGCAQPAVRPRPRHAGRPLAGARDARLAQRAAVFDRQRHTRLRRAEKRPAVPDLSARRRRRRTPADRGEDASMGRAPRRQRAELVPAGRRPGEPGRVRLRPLLQLPLPRVPHPRTVREVSRDRDHVRAAETQRPQRLMEGNGSSTLCELRASVASSAI